MPTEKQLADAARAEARAEFEAPKDAIALAKRMAKAAGKVKPQQMAEAAYMLVCCAAMAKDPQGYMDWIAAVGDLPAAAPKPEPVEPHVWLYDFMDGATTVRNWATTNKAEAFAEGNFNQRGYVPVEQAHGIKEQTK